MKLIGKGAEAELFLEKDIVIKKRIPKSYRIKEIDDTLRKTRTRRESKILQKLPKEIPAPELLDMNDKDMNISMSYIKGDKVRDILENNLKICEEIGEKIAIMHNAGIIHGDLTTSNMIYNKKVFFIEGEKPKVSRFTEKGQVFFIDFGLSFFSQKVEDKAVDLHLLRQALESKHHTVFKEAFELALKGYKSKAKDIKDILTRFEKVELRGRNKAK